MKILMFGWEFPPHISGGLGTACYGLTKGLAQLEDVSVLFVVPKSYGDEDRSSVNLVGASDVYIKETKISVEEFLNKVTFLEVFSKMLPYITPEDYKKFSTSGSKEEYATFFPGFSGKLKFTGKYGNNLFEEITNYAMVAITIARENDFDIIHAHDWLTYPAGIAAKTISGKPLVVHVHATDFDRSGGNVNPSVFEIEKKGMEFADRVVTVSNFTRNTVITKYGIPPEKVITVYNAVEPIIDREKIKFERGIKDKIVTFLGRITMQKGPEYFVEAANKVLKKMDNVRFVMAGSGDMMQKMVIRVAKLGIGDKFHFTGFLKGDDVFQMFFLSDVYVMPSVSEPFGISPLEAMQSNVPVIISNQSGVSEILNHAFKIDFWDIDAMADAIYGILNYEAMGNMFKEFGKNEVDNLKWETSAYHLKQIYDSLVNIPASVSF